MSKTSFEALVTNRIKWLMREGRFWRPCGDDELKDLIKIARGLGRSRSSAAIARRIFLQFATDCLTETFGEKSAERFRPLVENPRKGLSRTLALARTSDGRALFALDRVSKGEFGDLDSALSASTRLMDMGDGLLMDPLQSDEDGNPIVYRDSYDSRSEWLCWDRMLPSRAVLCHGVLYTMDD